MTDISPINLDVPDDENVVDEVVVTAILRTGRYIGDIKARVTVEEEHSDELAITSHPVEQGAAVSDHAYKQPASVTLRVAWTRSTLFALFNSNYVRQKYADLLDLQESRIPFSLGTGKRTYKNMLIKSLSVTTDQETENVLFATVVCQQIIMVETSTTAVPPTAVQANPAATAATENAGAKQLQPAPAANTSALQDILGSR